MEFNVRILVLNATLRTKRNKILTENQGHQRVLQQPPSHRHRRHFRQSTFTLRYYSQLLLEVVGKKGLGDPAEHSIGPRFILHGIPWKIWDLYSAGSPQPVIVVYHKITHVIHIIFSFLSQFSFSSYYLLVLLLLFSPNISDMGSVLLHRYHQTVAAAAAIAPIRQAMVA